MAGNISHFRLPDIYRPPNIHTHTHNIIRWHAIGLNSQWFVCFWIISSKLRQTRAAACRATQFRRRLVSTAFSLYSTFINWALLSTYSIFGYSKYLQICVHQYRPKHWEHTNAMDATNRILSNCSANNQLCVDVVVVVVFVEFVCF